MRIAKYDTLREGPRHILAIPIPYAGSPQYDEYLPTWCTVASFSSDRRPTFTEEGSPAGFFAVTASDDSYIDWMAHDLVTVDASSWPSSVRACSASGADRPHSTTVTWTFFPQHQTRVLLEDYNDVKTVPSPDVRCCNHFTDAYTNQTAYGASVSGPMYFTEIDPNIDLPTNDQWDVTTASCAFVSIGRYIWHASNTYHQEAAGVALNCWRPQISVSAASIGALGAVSFRVLSEMQAKHQDMLDSFDDYLYDSWVKFTDDFIACGASSSWAGNPYRWGFTSDGFPAHRPGDDCEVSASFVSKNWGHSNNADNDVPLCD